ncbi:MAG: glycosyltransferase [Candidatus Omnitrophota bacterium]|nr:glycosyltransferase [Candidatus Omnitrophota bacterium]
MMAKIVKHKDQLLKDGDHYSEEITFVGNYLPRKCGIATFTTDLREATQRHYGGTVRMPVIALNDRQEGYDYPDAVEGTILQSARQDYETAAEFVNRSNSKLVCLQHEYGIFGGDDGNYILDFLSQIRLPVVTTLHTVLEKPSRGQKEIIVGMDSMTAKFVVMSRKAKKFLHAKYDISNDKIAIIEHGIPQFLPGDPAHFKSVINLAGRTVLLSFGLLSQNKGVETVLEALPKVVKRFPKLAYVILGVTHPNVKKHEGESYRISLRRMVRELGLQKHVFFHDQFVALKQLTEYLQATDIYVTPYLSKNQIVSGTLAYASGSGIPVLSTPYWYAEELLAGGKGVLFPFRDSKRLGTLLLDLLGAPQKLKLMRKKAFAQGRQMIWPAVARSYIDLFHEVISKQIRKKVILKKRLVPTELPEISLRHVQRLTDDTGILQHAKGIVANRKEGYCLDDNARALIMTLQHYKQTESQESFELAAIYLAYIQYAQKENGSFRNFMNYRREFIEDDGSEDSQGRALWALGYAVQVCAENPLGSVAKELFHASKHLVTQMGTRATALGILALCEYLEKYPKDREVFELLRDASDKLVKVYKNNACSDWAWFEEKLTYDNAFLPLALLKAYRLTRDKTYLSIAKKTLSFLEAIYFKSEYLQLVGNNRWMTKSSKACLFDEQPVDAMASVLLFQEAYLTFNDKRYLDLMRMSFDWFVGKNRLEKPLYDFKSNGCRDGLMEKNVNMNQGAESTLCYLISLLTVTDVSYVDMSKPKTIL